MNFYFSFLFVIEFVWALGLENLNNIFDPTDFIFYFVLPHFLLCA